MALMVLLNFNMLNHLRKSDIMTSDSTKTFWHSVHTIKVWNKSKQVLDCKPKSVILWPQQTKPMSNTA